MRLMIIRRLLGFVVAATLLSGTATVGVFC